MATVTGSVQAVELVRGPDDAYGAEGATYTMYSASVSIWNNTASTVGAGDTLSTNVATAIQNSRRDGKTVTVRSCAVVGAAVVGGTSFTATSTFTGTNAVLTIKDSDWSTAATLPANTSTTQRYYRVIVGYSVA